MGFSLRRPGKTVLAPKRARFDNASGSDSDEEDLFAQAILKKAAKVLRSMEQGVGDEATYMKKLEEGEEPKKAPKPTGSKYLGLLLEAKRQRDQLQALNTAQVRDAQVQKQLEANSDLEVFETDAYKQQRDRALVVSVEEEEPTDMGLFYAKLLDDRTGDGGLEFEKGPVTEFGTLKSVFPKNGIVRETKANESHRKATKNASHGFPKGFQRTRESANTSEDEDSHSRFLKAVKEYVLSKVTEAELREYRKRFWQRRKGESHEW